MVVIFSYKTPVLFYNKTVVTPLNTGNKSIQSVAELINTSLRSVFINSIDRLKSS